MRHGKIIAAAIYQDGVIYSVPAPGRHHDVMVALRSLDRPYEQGFLTSTGLFVRRKLAALIAKEAGQITEPKWGDQLYSEDLW